MNSGFEYSDSQKNDIMMTNNMMLPDIGARIPLFFIHYSEKKNIFLVSIFSYIAMLTVAVIDFLNIKVHPLSLYQCQRPRIIASVAHFLR